MKYEDFYKSYTKETFGSPLNVEAAFVRFSDYTIRTVPEFTCELPGGKTFVEKDREFVIGKPPVIKSTDPFLAAGEPIDTLHTITFDRNIFFEILALGRNVDVNEGFNETTCSAINDEEILSLCRNLGLVYGGSLYKGLGEHWFGFDLQNFKYKIFTLNWAFSVHQAVSFRDTVAITRLLHSSIRNQYAGEVDSHERILHAARQWLCDYGVPSYIKTALSYDDLHERFVLKTQANNIFEVCNTFLMLIITASNQAGADTIKQCANPECNRYFYAKHRNAKYCPNCNRKTVWSRKQRGQAKKEE